MAFTVDKASADGYAKSIDDVDRHFVMRREVDFSVAANQLAQTEIMGLFNVPAGVLVEEVIMVVTTPDADITDVDIGSYTTAEVVIAVDGFLDGATLASAGIVRDLAGETYSRTDGTAGYFSLTDNWKIALINNDAQTLNEAVVEFYAICLDLR